MVPMVGERRAALILLLILCSVLITLPNIVAVRAVEDSWTTKASMPSALGRQGNAVVNGKIYVILGSINYEYDPALDTWATKKPMPTPRFYFGIAVYQNKIYIIGGTTDFIWSSDTGTTYTGVNEAYDPITDTWETKAPMPTNRVEVQTSVVNGKIYIMGGTTGYDQTKPEYTFCATNEAYDPLTNTWETKDPMPTKKKSFDANVVDNKIYCIGGDVGNNNYTEVNEVYDPTTDSWTTKAPIPIPVQSYQSVVLDNKIYVIITHGPSESNYNQIYDVKSDTWTSGENLPITIAPASVVATTGIMAPKRIYVIGGFTVNTTHVIALNTTYVYNPETDVWSSGASMPTSRYGVGVVVIDDVLYAIGGATDFMKYTAAVDQYTPMGYIPEFPSWIILPLFVTATLAVIIFRKRLA